MRRLDLFQEKGETTLLVSPKNILRQSFLSRQDNLAGIRFSVFNFRLGGNTKYLIKITDEQNSVFRSQEVTESNLGWSQMFRYDFPPIANSQNKTFFLEIVYAQEDDPDVEWVTKINNNRLNLTSHYLAPDLLDRVEKTHLGVLFTNTDVYKKGKAFLNNQPLNGDLAFQTFYQVNATSFIKDSFLGLNSRLKKDPAFLFVYIILLLVLTISFLKKLKILVIKR